MNQAASHATPYPTYSAAEAASESGSPPVDGRRASDGAAASAASGLPLRAWPAVQEFYLGPAERTFPWAMAGAFGCLAIGLGIYYPLMGALFGAATVGLLVQGARRLTFSGRTARSWLELGPDGIRVGRRSVPWKDVLYVRDETDDFISTVTLELRDHKHRSARRYWMLSADELAGITGPELNRLVRSYRIAAAGEF